MAPAPIPFCRLLTGAAIGLGLLWLSAWISVIDSREDIYAGIWLFGYFPLGAFVGVIVAVASEEMFRREWLILILSIPSWQVLALLLFTWAPDFSRSENAIFYPVHLVLLLGGWSALIWRVLGQVRVDRSRPGVLPLALAGLLAGRVALMDGMTLLNWVDRFGVFRMSGLTSVPEWVFALILFSLVALFPLCGLFGMSLFAWDFSLSWAWAPLMSLLATGAVGFSIFMLATHLHGDRGEWCALGLWHLVEAAWYAWWASRLAKEKEA